MTRKELRLRTTEIIQLLGDERFFSECVAFLFMRDQALAAVAQYHRAVASKDDCGGCPGGKRDESAYVRPVIATFVRAVRQIHVAGPQHLAPVKLFVSRQLGYHVDVVRLYYKENGRTHELLF